MGCPSPPRPLGTANSRRDSEAMVGSIGDEAYRKNYSVTYLWIKWLARPRVFAQEANCKPHCVRRGNVHIFNASTCILSHHDLRSARCAGRMRSTPARRMQPEGDADILAQHLRFDIRYCPGLSCDEYKCRHDASRRAEGISAMAHSGLWKWHNA